MKDTGNKLSLPVEFLSEGQTSSSGILEIIQLPSGFSGPNSSRMPIIKESSVSDCSDSSHEETNHENSSSGVDKDSKLSFWNAESCGFSGRNSSIIEESFVSDYSDSHDETNLENDSRDRLDKGSKLTFRNPAVSVCSDSSQHIKLTLYLKLI